MKRKEKERLKRDYGTKQQLPLVLVEEILERLGVKSLIRFTCVSKEWNSTIKSTSFALRHLIRGQSRDPVILIGGEGPEGCLFKAKPYSYLKTLELGTSEYKEIHIIPKPDRPCSITRSCDGLVCVYSVHSIYLINPATRWSRSLPYAKIQRVNRARLNLNSSNCEFGRNQLGLGKDIMTGNYKMVWLYNSLELGLHGDGHTTCEVFDFSTNTWRHVIGSSHAIYPYPPVYLDGLLHWLTHQVNGETKIIQFDLHTDVFQVMAEIPPIIVHASPDNIDLCSLNNHLCLAVEENNIQEIWLLNSHKVWEKSYSIGVYKNFFLRPITFFNKPETKLLFLYTFTRDNCLVVHNTITGSYSTYPGSFNLVQAISYFPSLVSV